MPRIEFKDFGGVRPSVDPRRLPAGAAQTAENLVLRYGDFRPLKGAGASVATVTSGAASIHRTPSGTWLQSATDADFVNGQINDPTVERVYVTGHAAYPEAWQSGTYRRLGVRTPAVAPAVVRNTTDEFTFEERNTAARAWIQTVRTAVLANLTGDYVGNGNPTVTSLGSVWFTHGGVSGLPTSSGAQLAYGVPMTGSTTTAPSDAYLMDPLLNGAQVTYLGNPYWAVPILWRAVGYTTDEAAVATAIKALTKPAPYTGQLVPDAVADEIAARIADIGDVALQPLSTLIARVNMAQSDLAVFVTRVLTDPARVYGLATAMQRLAATIQDIDAYFANFETPMEEVLADYTYLIPDTITREVETRFYVYTHKSDWGEESAPSEAVEVTDGLDQNDTATVTITAPASGGGYGSITHWCLYRSSTTDSGARYQFVDEVPIGTLSYTDSKTQEQLVEVLPTLTWDEPRAEMVGLTGGTNGIMLGFVGNTICACEAYTPYAWPRDYELSVEHDIVAIAFVGGQSWVVLTEGDPYLVSGADPANLSAVKLNRPQACVSKRSVVGIAGGALFASPDGICLADPSGVTVLTTEAYTQEDWAALTPSNSVATFADGVYHLWLGTAGKRISLDLARPELTVTTVTAPTAAYSDLLTDTAYAVVGTSVLPQFKGSTLTGVWKSGVIHTETQPSFAWVQARGDFTSVTVKVYADGVLVSTAALTSMEPKRLPATRGRSWEVQIEATQRVTSVVLASSSAELGAG